MLLLPPQPTPERDSPPMRGTCVLQSVPPLDTTTTTGASQGILPRGERGHQPHAIMLRGVLVAAHRLLRGGWQGGFLLAHPGVYLVHSDDHP